MLEQSQWSPAIPKEVAQVWGWGRGSAAPFPAPGITLTPGLQCVHQIGLDKATNQFLDIHQMLLRICRQNYGT